MDWLTFAASAYLVVGLCFTVCGMIHLWPEFKRDFGSGALSAWQAAIALLVCVGVLLFGWWALVVSWAWREFQGR